ncbi:hypothetical protein BGZ58_005378 [Dissophora ornata]|nr:hypothetical protein BGZ58_005378 [Dissophora ornata]
MFTKLDQMVESGAKWGEIGAALDSNVVTCQHQWRTLGKGRYRVKGVVAASQSISWTPQEVETFWESWLEYGRMDWKVIAADLRDKSVAEVRDAFRALTVSALQDAPGWAKLEAYNYVTDTSKAARGRKQREVEEILESSDGDQQTWTSADHEALLAAVEKHGLFSGWDNIREMVKPELSEDEVEAEYYRLNGVSMKTAARSEGSSNDRTKVVKTKGQDAMWTDEEINTLNTILMKYSTLPIWVKQAAEHGVEPADDDYETLFKKSGLSKSAADADADDSKSSRPPSSKAKKSKKKSSKSALLVDGKADSPWNDDRVKRLKRLVSQQQQQERASGHYVNWPWIAEHIGPGFNESMCITMWQSLPDHSIPQIEGPRFWEEGDMELLLLGISTHGKQWTLIQRDFLGDRTTDSIRRKVSNLQRKRDLLVEEARQKAGKLKAADPDLDVNAYMEENVKNDENYTAALQLEAKFDEYKKNKSSKARRQRKTLKLSE